MQHMAPPQYSPDGQWWWNGRSWVQVTWAVQGRSNPWAERGYQEQVPGGGAYDDRLYQDEEPRRRTPAVLWVGLIALLALLLLAFGATFVNWASLQGLGIGSQVAPPTHPPATTAPSAAPQTATSGADGYQQVVSADVARFQAAGQNVADRCAPTALAEGTDGCRTALQSMDGTVQGFQSDLAGESPPACLRPADLELRTALAEYHQGIQQELAGIDNQDLAAISQGGATFNSAANHAQNAGKLLQNSNC